MRFPKMRSTEQTREFIQEFGGLDRRVRGAENAFAEMRNMSSDFYPALSPRRPRGIVRNDMADCTALTACGKLAYIIGNKLYFGEGNDAVIMDLREAVTEKRQLVTMGAYLVVLPDNMYLNTMNTKDRGDFHVTRDLTDKGVCTFTLYQKGVDQLWQDEEYNLTNSHTVRLTGVEYDGYSLFHAPQIYQLGNVNKSTVLPGVPNIVLQPRFSDYEVSLEVSSGRAEIDTTYNSGYYLAIKFSSEIMHGTLTVKNNKSGVSVTHQINGCEYDCIDTLPAVNPKSGCWLRQEEGVWQLYNYDNDCTLDTVVCISSPDFEKMPNGVMENFSLVVEEGSSECVSSLKVEKENVYCKDGCVWIEGMLNASTRYSTATWDHVTVEFNAVVPKMDFVIEAKNRLWGCRHGQDANGNTVNEIYASALGDFREWYRLNDISTDSWIASVGHVGDFTGALNYRGYPLFFKENVMYKIYGDYPENFQIISDESTGVQAGCDKSLCVLSGLLYYRSSNGFMAYDGSSSVRIDTALGRERFTDAVCGGVGSKLYISMKGENGAHSGLYVYDTEKDLWHMEDGSLVHFFVPYAGDLYFLDSEDRLCTADGSAGGAETAPIVFAAETGIIGYSTPDSKYVSRLALRVSVPHDGYLNIFIEYNSAGVWEFKGSIEGNGLQSFTVPVVPQVCDHFRIRFAGEGNCRIFGFSKVLEEGGIV